MQTNSVKTIMMVIVSFFVIFLAVKQFYVFRQQVYDAAYYGYDK